MVSFISHMHPMLMKASGYVKGVVELLCRQRRQSVVIWLHVLWFIGVSVQQRIRKLKKSKAKNIAHLMVV